LFIFEPAFFKGGEMMAMPHSVFKKICVNELKGLSGQKRIKKAEELLERMPGYKDGPYANVRKWLVGQKDKAFISKKTFAKEQWEVKKQGDFSFAFIGLPSVGKSSLIKKLTNAQIEIAQYAFTTKKPFSATTKIDNALIQLIDLPGIIVGASQGKGFGKRVMGNAKIADKIILVIDSTQPNQISILEKELFEFGIELNENNACIIFTKTDLLKNEKGFLLKQGQEFHNCFVSIYDEQSIRKLKQFLFSLSNLIRIKPFDSKEFVILKQNSKVKDYCEKIHNEIIKKFKFALVTGSTKFPKQRVGLDYELKDFDKIELVLAH
jgi:small GTP-binding protein